MQKNKIRTKSIISAIIRNYEKDGGGSFLNSLERLKLSKSFDLYRTEEITPLIERYIKRYKTYLLYEYYKKSEIYQRFHYLKFQTRLDIVIFIKLHSKFGLGECVDICNKYEPYNWKKL